MNQDLETTVLKLSSGISLTLVSRGEEFLGIGDVSLGAMPLRDGTRRMLPDLRSPEGIQLVQPKLEVKQEGNGFILSLSYKKLEGGPMEWMLHTVRNRVNTADWEEGPKPCDAILEIHIQPAVRTFRGDVFHGFSSQYKYRSQDVPMYRIMDRATWEPGGSIVGSQLWLRNGTTPAIWTCDDLNDKLSTEWHLPNIEQPNIFQFFPFQVQMQGFTMTCSDQGTLITWATQTAHIRSLFEKKKGSGAMFHWHEHCGDLGTELTSSPMEILWADGAKTHVERINRHEAVREVVWAELHRQAGLEQERVDPYGVLEEWGLPDFGRYREKALPAFAEAGIQTIMIPNEFENNMNVWSVGNMCCTVDYKVAERVNPEKFRSFCRSAQERGITIQMWGNTALSSLTYMFRYKDSAADRIRFLPDEGSAMEALEGARAPWVRNASGAIEADHYTPVFCALNLREPKVVDYWHRRWREVKEDYGVEGIFIDSSFNMSADKFTWRQNDEFDRPGGATIDQTSLLNQSRPDVEPRKAIQTQYLAYLELLSEMQKYGYQICTEDVGMFGLSRSGPDMLTRLPALPLWQETYCDFDPHAVDDPDLVFFRGLAYRVMWKLIWHIPTEQLSWKYEGARDHRDHPTEFQVILLKIFAQLNDSMQFRTVLEGEKGVEWKSASKRTLWTFEPMALTLAEGEKAELLVSGKTFVGPEVVQVGRLEIVAFDH
jgi:hypothetical protein